MRVNFSCKLSKPDADGYRWGQVLRCGQWHYPGFEDGFEINDEVLLTMERNFAAEKARQPHFSVELNLEHEKGSGCGHVDQVETRGKKGDLTLWARFKVTEPEIEQKLNNGTYRFTSSEIDLKYVDPEQCKTLGKCDPTAIFEGLALTNSPYIKGMAPLDLSVSAAAHKCRCSDDKEVDTMAGSGDGDKDKIELTNLRAELAKKEAELEAANKKAETATAELTTLKANDQGAVEKARLAAEQAENALKLAAKAHGSQLYASFKAELTKLFGKGKFSAAAMNQALRLGQLLVEAGSTSIELKAATNKIRLDDTAAIEDAPDKLDILGEVVGLLKDAVPSELVQDEEDVVLDENGAPNKSGILDQADDLMKADPKLSRDKAIVLAAKKLGKKTSKGKEANK